jgi:hypothetical protein
MLVLFTLAVVLFGLVGLASALAYLVRKLLRKDTGRAGVIAASSFVFCIAGFVGFGITTDAEKSQKPQASNQAAQPDSVIAPARPQPQKAVDVVQAPAAPSSTPDPPKDTRPIDQQRFVTAVVRARDAYKAAPNEMAQGATRVLRARGICSTLTSRDIVDWEGTAYEISSNNDGRGVLAITIGPRVWVKTWNNALSDVTHGTLLNPSSAVYAAAVSLTKGQKVRFSGTLPESETDCVLESSITQSGSMTDPEFIIRFTGLTADINASSAPRPEVSGSAREAPRPPAMKASTPTGPKVYRGSQ